MSKKIAFYKYLILVGISTTILSFGASYSFIHTQRAIAERQAIVMQESSLSQSLAPAIVVKENTKPINILVPSVDLSLPIEIGNYDYQSHSWPINDTSAFYASVTSQLNTSAGQTVLYAHNKNNLFGKVKQLKNDDSIIIIDDTNQKFTYSLSRRKIVKPNDTAVFYEKSDKPTLVLITCDGLFDENRELIYFTLTGASK